MTDDVITGHLVYVHLCRKRKSICLGKFVCLGKSYFVVCSKICHYIYGEVIRLHLSLIFITFIVGIALMVVITSMGDTALISNSLFG